MGDNRPSVYVENGIALYRASALGGCMRALTAARLGMPQTPPPPWLQRAFDDGNRGEPVVIDMMADYGWEFEPGSGQDEVEFPITPTTMIRGHSDGKARPWITEPGSKTGKVKGERFLVEIKTMSANVFEDTWKRSGIKGLYAKYPAYPWQLSIYMIESGLPGMVVIGVKKKDGSGDVSHLAFHRVDEPPISLGQIKARVLQVEAKAKSGHPGDVCDVPAEGWCSADFLCQVREEDALIEPPVELDESESTDVIVLAQAYEQAKQDEADAKAIKEAMRQELIDLLADRKKIEVDGYTVTRTVATRKTLDTKAIKANLPAEVWGPYENESTTETLKVTVK